MPIEITGLFAAQRLCQELAIYPSGEILMYATVHYNPLILQGDVNNPLASKLFAHLDGSMTSIFLPGAITTIRCRFLAA